MALQDTVKKLFGKILKVGTPPEKEVLYKEVIKRKVPKESPETLFVNTIKQSFGKVLTTAKEKLQVSQNTDTTSAQETTKKKPTTKKTVTKKKPVTKKPATKKTTTKKSPAKKTSTSKKESTEKKTVSKKPVAKKTTTKKTVETKADTKTTSTKKPATKKKVTSTKKETSSKTSTVNKKPVTPAKASKKDEKIALYIKDIKKHYGEVDEDFVAIIVKNLGPSIYRKDAELVSCSDPKELDTVRRNFLVKKLGLDSDRSVLDAAITDVCEELKGVRKKYRATFYYTLAKKFKKESVLS